MLIWLKIQVHVYIPNNFKRPLDLDHSMCYKHQSVNEIFIHHMAVSILLWYYQHFIVTAQLGSFLCQETDYFKQWWGQERLYSYDACWCISILQYRYSPLVNKTPCMDSKCTGVDVHMQTEKLRYPLYMYVLSTKRKKWIL